MVSDFSVTDSDEALLRAAFPDELFGADPEAQFIELRETVQDSYADAWKHSASDPLCSLVIACAKVGDLEPLRHYRERAVTLAALTCNVDQPVSGLAVADIGRFDSMLRRVMILTEVAISELMIPEAEQIKSFSGRVPPEHESRSRSSGCSTKRWDSLS